MMNDTEGFFLNYVEDTVKSPQEKFLESILVKLYRSEDKIDKLSALMAKFISNNETKVNSILKL